MFSYNAPYFYSCLEFHSGTKITTPITALTNILLIKKPINGRNARPHSVLALMVPNMIITGWMVRVRFQAEERFSFRHHVHTGSGAQHTFYLMNSAASFPWEIVRA
jgi:hypothetical protein